MTERQVWRRVAVVGMALGIAWFTPGAAAGAPKEHAPPQPQPAKPSDGSGPEGGDEDGAPTRPPQDAPEVWPTAEPGQGSGSRPDSGLRPSPGRLVREGSFLNARRGRMTAVRSGGWLYLFDADAAGEAEPPMVLLPCLRLMEMERLVSAKQETVTFQISGQVTAYQGRNYLVVTYFTTLASEELKPTVVAPAAEQTSGSVPPNKDPSVHELLERAKPAERRADRPAKPAGAGAPTQGAAEGGRMLREGLTIAARRGRVQRGVGGAWVFMPDNGAGKSDGADPAMILQPCLNLERIERLIGDRGDRVVLNVSGQVYAYQSRNYLLPTVYRIEADREGNLGPGQ